MSNEHPIDIKDRSFYLQNCYEEHLLFPRTFSIPSRKDIFRLQIDDDVKLIFVIKNHDENTPGAERMWVVITHIFEYETEEKEGDTISKIKRRKFQGRLDNQPYYIKDIFLGDLIEFNDYNISSTMLPYDETINLDDYCLISKEALDQINSEIAVRYPDPQFDNDSGWRFYFGNDAENNILCQSDIKNIDELKKIEKDTEMVKIVIDEVIKKIRLLERVIEEEEGIFKFSERSGDFEKQKSLI